MIFNILRKKYAVQAEEDLNYLLKKRKYVWDILSKKDLDKFDNAVERFGKLQEAKLNVAEGEAQLVALQKEYGNFFETPSERSWRENVEVFFVALVIALAIRAYFIQPFKIPTHSMFPTLYGILPEKREGAKPNFLIQTRDFFLFGRTYHRAVVRHGGEISSVREISFLKFFKGVEIVIGADIYRLWTSGQNLANAGYSFDIGEEIPIGRDLVNISIQNGDHIFVNKMAYHFGLPRRGRVFVFTTRNISHFQEKGSQYYIKRCVGAGGDTLRVDPPHLFANGELLDHRPAFERIYSRKNGYGGYTLGGYLSSPNETYQVPARHFWAMGDNSANSFDSRMWGSVPRENLVGSAWFVYWPFGKRWGRID
ncbi:MAG: signal peptidase I [bacterium]